MPIRLIMMIAILVLSACARSAPAFECERLANGMCSTKSPATYDGKPISEPIVIDGVFGAFDGQGEFWPITRELDDDDWAWVEATGRFRWQQDDLDCWASKQDWLPELRTNKDRCHE